MGYIWRCLNIFEILDDDDRFFSFHYSTLTFFSGPHFFSFSLVSVFCSTTLNISYLVQYTPPPPPPSYNIHSLYFDILFLLLRNRSNFFLLFLHGGGGDGKLVWVGVLDSLVFFEFFFLLPSFHGSSRFFIIVFSRLFPTHKHTHTCSTFSTKFIHYGHSFFLFDNFLPLISIVNFFLFGYIITIIIIIFMNGGLERKISFFFVQNLMCVWVWAFIKNHFTHIQSEKKNKCFFFLMAILIILIIIKVFFLSIFVWAKI